jgi:hypothetical protein
MLAAIETIRPASTSRTRTCIRPVLVWLVVSR